MSHFVTFLALLLLVSSYLVMSQSPSSAGQTSVPCDQVINELSPCLYYLNGQLSSPPPSCCQGAKDVWSHYGKSKNKRQGVCDCLVSLMPLLGSNVNIGSIISALPSSCGLKFTLPPVNSNFNCSQIN